MVFIHVYEWPHRRLDMPKVVEQFSNIFLTRGAQGQYGICRIGFPIVDVPGLMALCEGATQ